MTPPIQIQIVSDQNELIFVSKNKDVFTYQYLVSKTKMGELLVLTDLQLEKAIRMEVFKPKN